MSTSQARFEQGLEIRRAVMGEEYTRRGLEESTDFGKPIQELVTEYCWGEIWGNESLERRTRSLINVAMLSVMNRNKELAAHAKGAIVNGATRSELQAVLLQVAIYCGMPVGLESFRVVEAALDEFDTERRTAAS